MIRDWNNRLGVAKVQSVQEVLPPSTKSRKSFPATDFEFIMLILPKLGSLGKR